MQLIYLYIVFSFAAQRVNIVFSLSDSELTSLDSSSDGQMTYLVGIPSAAGWKFKSVYAVIAAGRSGRYVYVYMANGRKMFMKEIEVFSPFIYG